MPPGEARGDGSHVYLSGDSAPFRVTAMRAESESKWCNLAMRPCGAWRPRVPSLTVIAQTVSSRRSRAQVGWFPPRALIVGEREHSPAADAGRERTLLTSSVSADPAICPCWSGESVRGPSCARALARQALGVVLAGRVRASVGSAGWPLAWAGGAPRLSASSDRLSCSSGAGVRARLSQSSGPSGLEQLPRASAVCADRTTCRCCRP